LPNETTPNRRIGKQILRILAFAKAIEKRSLCKRSFNMKATGIVRRIDDLGRVVIPKEIRRTMRIREGDPLEIYTSRDGEVIFKKYSLLGGVEDFASQLCETMSRSTGSICAVTDRDTIIAVAGGGKRELMGKRITPELEQIMESRKIYQYAGDGRPVAVSDSTDKLLTAVAAPILAEGDLLGLVLFISGDDAAVTGEAEYKLAQTIAAFLGRHMES
jgi:AbrB family transcriptional regulator (stage V sporulation protein T)